MGIRIQPREVAVPKNNPFEHDLLGREEPAKTLNSMVESLEGPCVVGIDAPWGDGKTTFLRMCAQHMRDEGFPVVEFNAWETDFAQDPFIALAAELKKSLTGPHPAEGGSLAESGSHAEGGSPADEFGRLVSHVSVQVLNQRQVVNQLIVKGDLRLSGERLDLSGVQDAMDSQQGSRAGSQNTCGQAMQGQNVSDQTTPGRAEAGSGGYAETAELVKALKKSFRDAVSPQPGGADGASEGRRPLVVFIDELDRCRPTYAIELLEAAKHLFAVDGVVFVLGVNRSELAQSVKAVYGASFEAEGYLSRFFDVEIRLPHPDRKKFIESQMQAIGLDEFLKKTEDSHAEGDSVDAQELLLCFFNTSALCLRDIEQAVHRLGVVLASVKSNERSFIMPIIFLTILRAIDRPSYDSLISGTASDREIIKSVFGKRGLSIVQREDEHREERLLFEAMAIISNLALRNHFYTKPSSAEQAKMREHSDMLAHCHAVMNDAESAQGTLEGKEVARMESISLGIVYTLSDNITPEIKDAKDLIRTVDKLHKIINNRGQVGLGFRVSSRRIELIWSEPSNH